MKETEPEVDHDGKEADREEGVEATEPWREGDGEEAGENLREIDEDRQTVNEPEQM